MQELEEAPDEGMGAKLLPHASQPVAQSSSVAQSATKPCATNREDILRLYGLDAHSVPDRGKPPIPAASSEILAKLLAAPLETKHASRKRALASAAAPACAAAPEAPAPADPARVAERCAAAAPVADAAADSEANYTIMHYQTSNAIAVRRKGGNQIFQLLMHDKTKAEAQAIAKLCVFHLVQGEDPSTVKAWGLKQMRKPAAS
jgi:hypothetical protein